MLLPLKEPHRALPIALIADISGLGGTATMTTLGTIAGGKIASKAGAIAKRFGEKAEAVGRIASSPTTTKRFLDKAADGGSKTAALASQLGGTKAADILFDATVDGLSAGAFNALEAGLAGADAAGVGEAFGMGLGAGGVIGGVAGRARSRSPIAIS